MTTSFTLAPSPIGRLLLVSHGAGLAGLYLEGHARGPAVAADWIDDAPRFDGALRQLDAYFAGRRATFDLALSPEGTPFQHAVWAALRAIPFGETITYAELARRIGKPGSARAVGHANARNPISIIVPCHRVIGVDGSLTGYAGGEDRKRWLLTMERTAAARPAPVTPAITPRATSAA